MVTHKKNKDLYIMLNARSRNLRIKFLSDKKTNLPETLIH